MTEKQRQEHNARISAGMPVTAAIICVKTFIYMVALLLVLKMVGAI